MAMHANPFRTACLVVALAVVPASAAMAGAKLDARLRQVMVDCGRPGYVLRPAARKRLVITAVPTIRQTPLSRSDLNCIRREAHKLGWKLAMDERR